MRPTSAAVAPRLRNTVAAAAPTATSASVRGSVPLPFSDWELQKLRRTAVCCCRKLRLLLQARHPIEAFRLPAPVLTSGKAAAPAACAGIVVGGEVAATDAAAGGDDATVAARRTTENRPRRSKSPAGAKPGAQAAALQTACNSTKPAYILEDHHEAAHIAALLHHAANVARQLPMFLLVGKPGPLTQPFRLQV